MAGSVLKIEGVHMSSSVQISYAWSYVHVQGSLDDCQCVPILGCNFLLRKRSKKHFADKLIYTTSVVTLEKWSSTPTNIIGSYSCSFIQFNVLDDFPFGASIEGTMYNIDQVPTYINFPVKFEMRNGISRSRGEDISPFKLEMVEGLTKITD